MAIERISELDWASFEKQLIQKCPEYEYAKRSGQGDSIGQWSIFDGSGESGGPADAIYGIQQQIVYNADALLGVINNANDSQDTTGRYDAGEIYFWNDLVPDPNSDDALKGLREGYENTLAGRQKQLEDSVFNSHASFNDTRTTQESEDWDETSTNLSNWPKTHAAKSLIEISEWVGRNAQYIDRDDTLKPATHSNYVSRKVSMLWFFNVIKAIVDLKRVFRWLIVGCKTGPVSCSHSEAEQNVHADGAFGDHKFKRSTNPSKDGVLRVYGDAELNGQYTTFHSQTRFHDEMRVWDKMSVYGQSYFAKDIDGTAMRVRWGDLAEYYKADAPYGPGTLVKFGGPREVTLADDEVNAVVTTRPGLVLNNPLDSNCEGYSPVALALVGRVPVKVWSPCRKFDLIVADPRNPGWAKVKTRDDERVIGRALEDCECGKAAVLCATKFSL